MEKQPVYGPIKYGLILGEERELAKSSYQYISNDIEDIGKGFIKLGFHLAECRDMEYYKDFGYDNFYEFVEKNFHMEKTAVSRHINVFMRFSEVSGNSHKMWLDNKYVDYSFSQLSEMLQLDEKQLTQVKPEMTVKEIRNLKKKWKGEKSCDVATKKSYTECAAYKFHTSCRGCFYHEKNNDCSYDKTGYFEPTENKEVIVAETDYKELPKEKEIQTEVSGESCSYNSEYVCQITDVIREYFYLAGKVDKCTGCCIKCPTRADCEYECAYACTIDRQRKERQEKIAAENREEKPEEQTKELPLLKNMEEREKFILNFKEWNIWCRNELTEETYYRFDLPDKAAIVVRSYPVYMEWKKEETEGKDLFLLKPGYKHFKNCETNMTAIKDYLKDLQKKK